MSRRVKPAPELTGKRFGKWIVTGEAYYKPGSYWYVMCTCDCGTIKGVAVGRLLDGKSKSCGCKAKAGVKHGDTCAAGFAPEYRVWSRIKTRCFNQKDKSFPDYGGRGISVFEGWVNSYEEFLAHVGRRPSPEHSIERIDNNKGYEPGNVRWATKIEQCNNRRTSHFVEFGGKRQTLAQWGRELGIDSLTLQARLKSYGWSVERALTTPVLCK